MNQQNNNDDPRRATAGGAARQVLRLAVLAAMFTAALMLAGGAVWQLWLSDVWADWEQHRLEQELLAEEENPALVMPAGMTLAAFAEGPPTTEPPDLPRVVAPPSGQPMGRVAIPSIGVDTTFVAGTTASDLRAGAGWMIGTSLPGMPGNSTISGHRTTYGGPFRHIDQLEAGDRIVVSQPGVDDSVFEVRAKFVVEPTDVWVAAQTGGVRLTLTSCHPVGSARERLIVQAELVEGPAVGYAQPLDAWQPSTP